MPRVFGLSKMTPIFIFSLPRSGSTLLQKIIASSGEVSTASEPWVLLPVLYAQKECGTVAEYSHEHSRLALTAVKEAMQEKGVNYDDLVRAYAESLYTALSSESSRYFLDKTPRYYLVIDEILRTFPNAKFIFLFRNPLSQLSSHLHIHKGRVRTMYFNAIDIIYGHKLLADGYRGAQNCALKLTYSQLVSDTKTVIEELNDFLGLDIQPAASANLQAVNLRGRMGDPELMANASKGVNDQSLVKWKADVNSMHRKMLVERYLRNIDESYFEYLGQRREDLLRELASIRVRRFANLRDCYDMTYCWLNMRFQLALNFSSKYQWKRYKRLS